MFFYVKSIKITEIILSLRIWKSPKMDKISVFSAKAVYFTNKIINDKYGNPKIKANALRPSDSTRQSRTVH